MDSLVITGVPPYDGEYDLDLTGQVLSTLEWRWVKKISGYLPLTIAEGMEGGDPDVVVALAVIALRRAGKIQKEQALQVAEVLADPPFDGVTLQLRVGEVEGEARPPASPPPSGSENDSGGGEGLNEKTEPSGNPGLNDGDQLQPSPSPTGSPGSEDSAAFAQPI